ncbi:unnamed protein product [Rhizophagus irregularis]|nr:unnamed protein product [Rhizophagus irregularis]CAB4435126.1 unnamed protein product [Rhizophagus irregularis]
MTELLMDWVLTGQIKVREIDEITIKEGKDRTIIHLEILDRIDEIYINVDIIISYKEKKIKLIMDDGENIVIQEGPIEKGLGWIRYKLIIGNEKYIYRMKIPQIENKNNGTSSEKYRS